MKIIYAFSLDFDDHLIKTLQEKTFEGDYTILGLHKSFKIHKCKRNFLADVNNYISTFTSQFYFLKLLKLNF